MTTYNLKRIAMNILMNKEDLHSMIRESQDGRVDYWTSIETPNGEEYDINVYCADENSQPMVHIHEKSYDSILAEFPIDLDALMPAISDNIYRVRFEFISHYHIDIHANDAGEALKRAKVYMDKNELIKRGEFNNLQTKITTVEEMQ